MVNKRRAAIIDLIQSKAIGSQEELMHELSKLGFIVSQATVSHDIRDLGIVKKKVGFGYQYELGTVKTPQVDSFEERYPQKGNSRRDAILEIIQSKSIGSQDELVQELSKLGFLVTQATISRDISDLGLVKSRTGTGFRYVTRIKETSSRDDYSGQTRISQSFSSDSISMFETESEMRARIEAELRAKIEAEIRAKMSAETTDIGADEEQSRCADTSTKKKFNRPYVFDQRLSASLDRAFNKLEAYFPEGKVFALDNIDGELRETLASLYKRAGYKTIDDMFSNPVSVMLVGALGKVISPKAKGFAGIINNILTIEFSSISPIGILVMAPGAFFVLATLTMIQNVIKDKGAKAGKDTSKIGSGCSHDCLSCGETGCAHRIVDNTVKEETPATEVKEEKTVEEKKESVEVTRGEDTELKDILASEETDEDIKEEKEGK